MSLSNQLPLNAQERQTGSLSDILPELQDLVDGTKNGTVRRSLQAVEAATLRQLMQRSATVPTAAQALTQQQLSGGPAAPSNPLWSRISALNIDLSAASPQQSLGSGSATSNLPASLPTELVPYATLLQAQAGLLGSSGNHHQIWQQLLQAAPGIHQQQLQAQMARKAVPQEQAIASLPQRLPSSEAPSRVSPQPVTTGFAGAALPDVIPQGIKRGVDGKPKAAPCARPNDGRKAETVPRANKLAEMAALKKPHAQRIEAPAVHSPPSGGLASRSSRLQEQNKQAQQRYRERRRQKVAEMEGQLAEMQKQAEELQSTLRQNVILQEKVLRLETALAEKKAECQRLAAQSNRAASASKAPPPPLTAIQLTELGVELQTEIMQLELLAKKHRLHGLTTPAEELEAGIAEQLSGATAQCIRLCQQAQEEGVLASDLLLTNRAAVDASPPEGRWTVVLKDLQLSEVQRIQLTSWHKQHVKQLKSIAAARQPIAQRVSEAAARHACEKASANVGPADAARRNLGLLRDLASLQESLTEEAQLAQQFSRVVTTRILTPAQATGFVIDAWPAFCDCLALTSALVAQCNDE